GIPAKKFRSRKIANGSPNATWNAITDGMVPQTPSQPYSFDTGINPTCTGTTRRATTMRNSQSRPGNSSHANAYAASDAIPTTSKVAGTAISTVFQNESTKSGLASRSEYALNVSCDGAVNTCHQPEELSSCWERSDATNNPNVGTSQTTAMTSRNTCTKPPPTRETIRLARLRRGAPPYCGPASP